MNPFVTVAQIHEQKSKSFLPHPQLTLSFAWLEELPASIKSVFLSPTIAANMGRSVS
ncbi:hypothetical protein BLGI_75 [Brevibacillus laterosporus GI-9]|nr:hypothetical protein BLGI_75 [Brevibacillus laterosporus GI-9]